jgi:hypothetical protein
MVPEGRREGEEERKRTNQRGDEWYGSRRIDGERRK